MPNYVIFGGTTEGRLLAAILAERGAQVTACTATEYGGALIKAQAGLHVHTGRMTKEQMKELMENGRPLCVIDATHPYAVEVTEHIKKACQECDLPYVRLLRPAKEGGQWQTVGSMEEAAEFLCHTKGAVLLTTGSKELEPFTRVPDFENRIFARVLPTPGVMEKCRALGFLPRNIIGMQGPFGKEMNLAMLRQLRARWMVTKESGDIGGFEEKLEAAQEAEVNLLVVGRPRQEQGLTLEQVVTLLEEGYQLPKQVEEQEESRLRFPLFFDLKGKKVVVVGGGTIATRRVESLLPFGCQMTVISPKASERISSLAAQGHVRWLMRRYEPGDCQGAMLVTAATNERETNHSVGQECRSLGIPVSVADVKEECSVFFPAIVRGEHLILGLAGDGSNHHQVRKTAAELRAWLQKEEHHETTD